MSTIVVNINDTALYANGLDGGGVEIYEYNGQPFTGVVEEYKNNILIGSYSYINGYREGLQKDYWNNGQLATECIEHNNIVINYMKHWDELGNLLYHAEFDDSGNTVNTIVNNY